MTNNVLRLINSAVAHAAPPGIKQGEQQGTRIVETFNCYVGFSDHVRPLGVMPDFDRRPLRL